MSARRLRKQWYHGIGAYAERKWTEQRNGRVREILDELSALPRINKDADWFPHLHFYRMHIDALWSHFTNHQMARRRFRGRVKKQQATVKLRDRLATRDQADRFIIAYGDTSFGPTGARGGHAVQACRADRRVLHDEEVLCWQKRSGITFISVPPTPEETAHADARGSGAAS
ncbi:putative mitochondrial protein [Andalucia godoyi]|uniref:Putative mitochondrial protein n=1 Tax=Andalucia godoyi TaxID=505711 RepID=A0A8K0AGX1_ANDGO|nr:putative mitochondrial protein [Andalucia godoyi]|eukprot:ANDGO_04702.mRNA.1 putative mitochondrial protein